MNKVKREGFNLFDAEFLYVIDGLDDAHTFPETEYKEMCKVYLNHKPIYSYNEFPSGHITKRRIIGRSRIPEFVFFNSRVIS